METSIQPCALACKRSCACHLRALGSRHEVDKVSRKAPGQKKYVPEIHNDLEQFARVHATDVNSLHRSSLGSWKGCSAPESARANASAVSVRESISVTFNGDESALTMRLLDSVCVSVRTLEQTKSISLTFNAIECERAGLCLFECAYTHTDGIQQPRRHLGVLHWIRLKHPEGNGFRLCECRNTQTNGAHLIQIPWHRERAGFRLFECAYTHTDGIQ